MTRRKLGRSAWVKRLRKSTGNMLALMVACAVGFFILLMFALSYVRMLGSHGEQKTAIESASLAAAKDISKIVINDPNFGYIGFSDSAPVGAATKAADNYYMPVSSINSMMGTVRLDTIIANEVNNPEMKALAARDLTNLKAAKDNLVLVIRAAIAGSGSTAKDADGNIVSPYDDAVAAYKSNSIRMAGSSNYVEGSLKLTLGSIANGETNIPIPQPTAYANCDSTQQKNGMYVANVNVPTSDGTQFVFANLGTTVRLVDDRTFLTTVPGVAFEMPAIVRAEADQSINSNGTTAVQHSSASAQGSNLYDPRPAPGLFSINFPDGVPPEVQRPGDLLKPPFTTTAPVVGSTPVGGDYPSGGGGLSTIAPGGWSGLSGPPTAGGSVGIGMYDWLKRGGAKVNVSSVKKFLTTNFNDSGNLATDMLTNNFYMFDAASGNVVYTSRKLSDPGVTPPTAGNYNPPGPDKISTVAENQLFTQSQNVFTSADLFSYDMYMRDESFKNGTINGGDHGGEPLSDTVYTATTSHIDSANVTIACDQLEPVKIASNQTSGSGSSFDCGGQGDGAHWGLSIGGPPYTLLAQIDVSVPTDGHLISFSIYGNALNTRNDWIQAPIAVFSTGSTGGTNRPTYLQNGLVSEVRFRRVISLAGTGLLGAAYANFGKRVYPPPSPPLGAAPINIHIP